MHLVVRLQDGENFTVEVKRVYTGGCVNDYGIKDKRFIYFQFDTSDRPSDFKDEFREEIWFRGYLIGRTKKGEHDIIECNIQVKGK